jgi:hypothetical protein
MTAPRVEIVIDRMVFHGLEPAEARSAATAFEVRLAALAARPAAAILARTEAFRTTPAVGAPTRSPAAIGEAAAGAVWSAVSRGPTP